MAGRSTGLGIPKAVRIKNKTADIFITPMNCHQQLLSGEQNR
jgi:hypothetical protein